MSDPTLSAAPTPTVPAGLHDLAFLHLGRPESGVRRYGRLIAAEARQRPGLTVREVEAGRLDEDAAGQLSSVAGELADAQVVVMQWNRRGWGTRGRSLARLARFRRAYRGALVVTLHDIFERQGIRERVLQPEAWSLRFLGRTADVVVVHSEVEVGRLRGLVPASRMRVIPHFVEHRVLSLSPTEARSRLGLSGRRVVTLLGFVYGRKGHRYAVEAVPHMPADAVLVYAGGPVAGRSFVYDLALSKAKELDLGDRFRITGYLSEEELETWMAATDLAILPFTDLSASGSLSTWIGAGKPMLASDLPGFREYDRSVPGALHFFAPSEAGPLAAAVSRLLAGTLEDPDPLVRQLAQELSLARTVDRYLAVAAEALAAHRA